MEAPNGKVRIQIYQQTSTASAIRSAIGWMYNLARVTACEEMKSDLSKLINGLKRNESAAKAFLGLKITTGKEPLTQEAFEFLAKKLFYSADKKDVFAHLFFVLDWCLMKRAENVDGAKINHISFKDDALVFEFAKSKGDQTGDPHGPWHVYANPLKPWMCPVLSLARYLFCYPERMLTDMPLFEGTNQYARYSTRFMQLIRQPDVVKDLKDMVVGFEPEDLGTHSSRKGVATMVASGCTVGPPIVSLCIRAGWSLGGVKDKYLFRENAGDMHVGRCASCHDPDTKEYAISPVYFDFTHLEEAAAVSMKKEIREYLESHIPNHEAISSSTWKVVNMCFAAICNAYDHLKENLHEKCPLRSAAVFRDIPDTILALATTKYPWDKTADTPKATGIPPHVFQLAKMEALEKKMDLLQEGILDGMRKEMSERGFASTQYNTSEITDVIQSAFSKMMEKFDSIGVSNNTSSQQDVGFIMTDESEGFLDGTVVGGDHDAAATGEERQLAQKQNRMKAASSVEKRTLTLGFHHGKLNPLPANWKPTSMTCLQLIQNWFISNKRDNIPALCNLDSRMVEHLKMNKYRNSMKSFMSIVEKFAREKECWNEKPSLWSIKSVNSMWKAIEPEFKLAYCKTKRKGELTWKTAYNNMSKADAFGNIRNKARSVA